MAMAFIIDLEGATLAQYDAVMQDMQLNGTLPEHALYHAAGEAGGHLYVFDVWETAEAFEAYAAAKIAPLTAKHGAGEPTISAFPVTGSIEGTGGDAAIMQFVELPGVDAATFDALHEAITGSEQAAPDHLITHVNGPIDGGWCVIDVWGSVAAYDAFLADRVGPAAARFEVAPPQITAVPVYNTLTKARTTA